MWPIIAKFYFDELIETLTPEQFKIFFKFMYEMSFENRSTLHDRVNAMYIDALAKHNTEMIKIFEDDEFTDNYWWAFRDYIINNFEQPNLHYIMSCVKYHLKNNNKNLIYKFDDIIDDIDELTDDIDELTDENQNRDYVIKYFLMFGCNYNTIFNEHINIDRWMI